MRLCQLFSAADESSASQMLAGHARVQERYICRACGVGKQADPHAHRSLLKYTSPFLGFHLPRSSSTHIFSSHFLLLESS